MTSQAMVKLADEIEKRNYTIMSRPENRRGHIQRLRQHEVPLATAALRLAAAPAVTAWLFDGVSTMPLWLIEKYRSQPLPEHRKGQYALAADGEFWRWSDAAKFNEMFCLALTAPPLPADGPGTDLIEGGIAAWIEAQPSDVDIRNAAIEECALAAEAAKLPDDYQWGRDAMEQFNFGKRRAADAIRATKGRK